MGSMSADQARAVQETESVRRIYDPELCVRTAMATVQHRVEIYRKGYGVHSFLPGMEELIPPWVPPDFIGILAFTSNGKTTFMNYIAKQNAYRLQDWNARNPDKPRIIVYASWEQAVEQQTIFDLGGIAEISPLEIMRGRISDDEINLLAGEAANKRTRLPIWFLGPSVEMDLKRDRYTLESLDKSLRYIKSQGVTIDMLIMDYLQRIRRDGEKDIREGFMEVIDQAKDYSLSTTTFLLSQAKRECTQRQDPVPEVQDSQETSNFEQSVDYLFALAMPKFRYDEDSPPVRWHCKKDYGYKVGPGTIFMSLHKSKWGPAPVHRVFNMGIGGKSMEEVSIVFHKKET